MAKPELNYSYFSYGIMDSSGSATTKVLDHLPTTGDSVRVSFQEGFNAIKLKYTPSCPLCYYEIRITEKDDAFGIGVGTLWDKSGPNIAGSTEQTVNLEISSTYFPIPSGKTSPDGNYRIGLYAKSADSEGLWDVTYLLLSSEGYMMVTSDKADGIELLTDEPIPSA